MRSGSTRRDVASGVFLVFGAAMPRSTIAEPSRAVATTIGHWGVDLAGMDRTVKPGDDFFRYAGGTWIKQTPIPPDRSSWGPFYILRANAEADVRSLVED